MKMTVLRMPVEPVAQNTALGKKPESTVSMLHLSCVAGRAHATGTLNVVFSHRDQVVNVSGVLAEQIGRGSWKSPTKDCSGSWIARKG